MGSGSGRRGGFGQFGEQELAAGGVVAAQGAAPDERARFGLGDGPAGAVFDVVVVVAEWAEVDPLGGAAVAWSREWSMSLVRAGRRQTPAKVQVRSRISV